MITRHIVVGPGSTMGSGEAVISDAVRFGDLLILSGRVSVKMAPAASFGFREADAHGHVPIRIHKGSPVPYEKTILFSIGLH